MSSARRRGPRVGRRPGRVDASRRTSSATPQVLAAIWSRPLEGGDGASSCIANTAKRDSLGRPSMLPGASTPDCPVGAGTPAYRGAERPRTGGIRKRHPVTAPTGARYRFGSIAPPYRIAEAPTFGAHQLPGCGRDRPRSAGPRPRRGPHGTPTMCARGSKPTWTGRFRTSPTRRSGMACCQAPGRLAQR